LLLYCDGQQWLKYNATQLCMNPFVVLVPVNANKEGKGSNVKTSDDARPVATRYASHVTPETYSTLLQVGFRVASEVVEH